MTASFGPARRLRKRAEFKHVYETGVKAHGQYMSIFCVATDRGTTRLGVTATRKLGGAVQRNRAKRRLREVFRRRPETSSGLDVVVNPRPSLLVAAFEAIEAEYGALLQRVQRRPRH